jgi:phosphoribosylpyrophosphate synthetase
MKYLNELANIHSALTEEYLDHYAFIERIREKNFQQEIKTIRTILIDGNNKNLFSIEDIELTSFAIISALKGLEYPWSTEISLPKIQENIDKLLDILFNGIVKR